MPAGQVSYLGQQLDCQTNYYRDEEEISLGQRYRKTIDNYDQEPSRLENSFHLFSAGGRDFLSLCLEFGPRKGIRSTRKNAKTKGGTVQSVPVPIPQVAPPVLPQYHEEPWPYPGPAYDARIEGANIIKGC